MKYLSILFSFALIVFTTAVYAQGTQRTPEIQKAERYLQSLKTAKARFTQTTSDGPQLTGDFYLSRPGKLRFQYDAPLKDYIVADGAFIYFYDGDINEQSNAPIGQTLADFILRSNIRLTNDDLNIKRIMHVDNMVQITIEQKTDPDAGSITLGFQKKPFQLKKWRVVDAVGSVTEIELTNLQTGIKFPSSLFAFFAPKKEGFND